MNRKILVSLLVGASLAGAFPLVAHASIEPEKIHSSEGRKTDLYISDGIFSGGDHAQQDVIVRGIRRAANPKYERIVIDIAGNSAGEPTDLSHLPYYQVAVSPENHRLTVTIWGKPKLAFDSRKVVREFKRSPVISQIALLPQVNPTSWTFAMQLKSDHPAEVFQLSSPARIIIDIRRGKDH